MQSNIIRTLSYAQVFGFPLTLKELHTRLVGKKISLKALENQINRLGIKSHQGYYFLGNKSGAVSRIKNKKHLNSKIDSGKKIAKILKVFPSIQAVLITGAIAAKNPKEDDDIDFLIITKSNTLWITRLLVNILLDALHLRRTPVSKNSSDKACLNLWLTSKSLSLSVDKRNLYSAYEIALCMPIWERNNTYDSFLHKNKWISDFLPNTPISRPPLPKNKDKASFLDIPAYRLQSWYMKSKKTKEIITKDSAFFHPRNTKEIIVDKYNQIYKKYSKVYLS